MNHYKIEYKNGSKCFSRREVDAETVNDAVFIARISALSDEYAKCNIFDVLLRDEKGKYHKISTGIKL